MDIIYAIGISTFCEKQISSIVRVGFEPTFVGHNCSRLKLIFWIKLKTFAVIVYHALEYFISWSFQNTSTKLDLKDKLFLIGSKKSRVKKLSKRQKNFFHLILQFFKKLRKTTSKIKSLIFRMLNSLPLQTYTT